MKRFNLMVMILVLFGTLNVHLFAQDPLAALSGTWTLQLPHNGFNDAGWLEINPKEDLIETHLLWYGGSVNPMSHAYWDGKDLVITQSRERKAGMAAITTTDIMKVHLEGGVLYGTRYTPAVDGRGVKRFTFSGTRREADPPRPDLSKLKFGDPISLLQPESLQGWRLIGTEAKNGWQVKNGVLTNDPVQDSDGHVRYGNLRTDHEFEDFKLNLEVNIPEKNNSGIYLRGIYEIQVFDSYGKPLDSHHMGALYSRIVPAMAAEKPAGEWQSFEITLVNRHLTVVLNDKTIIDNQPVRGCTGGALTSNEAKPGPIYLQGDHGKVSYRNIVLTPIIP